MSYPYENTTPERFQQLCQALLLDDFPDLQCLPVGQPDGGRDAVSGASHGSPLTVFQVKFKRKDEDVAKVADWVISTLEGELTKIEGLIAFGLTKYIFVTNVAGTSHLRSGSIDKVQGWLSEHISIPATCLWRDDLDRRLDRSFSIKWQYPEVLSGSDGIRLALESHLIAHKSRRAKTLSRFVSAQLDMDSIVKFKQVDLSNDLLDLFIDVPVTVSRRFQQKFSRASHAKYTKAVRALGVNPLAKTNEFEGTVFHEPMIAGLSNRPFPQIGAAQLLMTASFAHSFPRVVLEGGPGQGKSTLAQFMCQVHRIRYVDHVSRPRVTQFDLTPARFPIKVDLRDLSAWIAGIDPFAVSDEPVRHAANTNLETFVARLIQFQSGASSFDVIDLEESFAEVPILLFLDGLDEVADVRSRAQVVDCVNSGCTRLDEAAVDLQVIVTSRPPAFANSPGFSERDFTYFELQNVPRALALDYAMRWCAARSLDERETSAVRAILFEKLNLSHIADLARNPMQLAILLGLIHSVGYSLPDERTELYASYMDRFLTREAEKSPAVRRYRSLIVKLHQHLAWVLQSSAELSPGSRGSISASDLRALIEEYLIEREHETSIVDELFSGMLERVYVLVQRMQGGAYEFEVQPLREYFCAMHLYETAAPYLESGQRAKPDVLRAVGTRSERFAVLAQNAYWTNVTRFYAGRYTTGELGGLCFQLQELIEDTEPKLSLRLRSLACMLLSDWVFRDDPRALRQLISTVFDDFGLKGACVGFTQPESEPVSLPSGCGRQQVADALVSRIMGEEPLGAKYEYARMLAYNETELSSEQLKSRALLLHGESRSEFIGILARAQVGLRGDVDFLDRIVLNDSPNVGDLLSRVETLLMSGADSTQWPRELIDASLAVCLRGRVPLIFDGMSWIALMGQLTNSLALTHSLRSRRAVLISLPARVGDWRSSLTSPTPAPHQVVGYLTKAVGIISSGDPGLKNFDASRAVAAEIENHFGECWSPFAFAISISAFAAPRERGAGAKRLSDSTQSVIDRARYARLYGNRRSGWWEQQFKQLSTQPAKMFWACLLLLWATPSELQRNLDAVDALCDGLAREDFEDITSIFTNRDSTPRKAGRGPQGSIGDRLRLLLILSGRIDNDESLLRSPDATVASCAPRTQKVLSWRRITRSSKWLASVRERFERGDTRPVSPGGAKVMVAESICREILKDTGAYPASTVVRAAHFLPGSPSQEALGERAAALNWTF